MWRQNPKYYQCLLLHCYSQYLLLETGIRQSCLMLFSWALSEISFLLVHIIMEVSSIGEFALIAGITVRYGLNGIYVLFGYLLSLNYA